MKIIILGPAHPFRGGMAAFNERIAKELIVQGHEVIIYTFSLQYPSFLFPGKSQNTNQPAPANLNIKIKVNSINPLNWLRVGNEIKKLNPDLLLVKYWLPFMAPCFGTINRMVKKNNKTKIVCIADNIVPHEKRMGDKVLTKYFIKSVDAFIVMSKSVLDELNTFDTIKPKLLTPHPLYDNFGIAVSKIEATQHLALDENTPYILFFGFIRDYKGLDILLNAMNDERIRNSEIKLIVAGEFYSDSKSYLDLIKQHNVEGKIILRTDFIPDNEVRYYFCVADLVVQPYKHATQSGVTQICYHFNSPMLVTNVGGLPEIVPHNVVGYIAEPNPNSVADGIWKFYSENKKDVFTQGIKKEKAKYSWSIMVKKVFEVAQLK